MSKEFQNIIDAFDIQSGDTSETSDYGTTADKGDELSVEKFDSLTQTVNENITDEKGYELEMSKTVEEIVEEAVNAADEEKEEKAEEGIIVEDRAEGRGYATGKDVEISFEEADVVEDIVEEELVEPEETEEGDEDEYLGRRYFEDGKINWNFESPSQVYDIFYFRKKDLIEPLINIIGELDFQILHDELKDSSVRVGKVYDSKVILDEMTQVQQYRERVKEIHLQILRQFFLWELSVEQLEGELAKTRYLKPVAKQKGLMAEHMGDVQYYYAELRGVKEAAKKVEEHLDKAYETLSRKATICEPLKPVERHFVPREEDDLSSYDALPKDAVAGKKGLVEGEMDWDDIPL
jgi:hypothetical protein